MSVTTEYGKQNIFGKEPKIRTVEATRPLMEESELLNGRLAMIGFVAGAGAYLVSGDIIPGIL